MYDGMYKGSNRYKDACEIGKREYAALYRTLIFWVAIKQKQLNVSAFLFKENIQKIVLVGAGDICSLLVEEIGRDNVEYIIEDRKDKFEDLYLPIPMKFWNELGNTDCSDALFVVTDQLRFNDIVMRLKAMDIDIDRIISIEELVSCIAAGGIG